MRRPKVEAKDTAVSKAARLKSQGGCLVKWWSESRRGLSGGAVKLFLLILIQFGDTKCFAVAERVAVGLLCQCTHRWRIFAVLVITAAQQAALQWPMGAPGEL